MTEHRESKNQKRSNRIKNYARFSGVAFQMIIVIGLGSYMGVKLDNAYPNKYSLFTIVFSLMSVAIALYYVIRQVSDFSKDDD